MIFDGVSYNYFSDEELEKIKHQYYLEQERIEKDHVKNTVSCKKFKEEFKKRYSI